MAPLSTVMSRRQAAILRACRLIGGRTKLARKIGASASQINNWINRGDIIPYNYALLINKAVNNLVTLDRLCPEMRHVNRMIQQQASITQIPLTLIKYHENGLQQQARAKPADKHDAILLAQPLLVDLDYQLLAFPDRLYAHSQAKSATVPAIVIDVAHHLQTKNPIECVVHLCPLSEKIRVGESIRQQLGSRRGRPPKDHKVHQSLIDVKGRSLDVIALLLGFGNRVTYNQAKRVLLLGCPALVQAMDDKRLSIATAAKVAELTSSLQQQLLAQDKKIITQYLKQLPATRVYSKTLATTANTAVFKTQQQLVDILKIYHWLVQQGAPVIFEQQQGEYRLIWRLEK